MTKDESLAAIKSMIVATINDDNEKAEQLHATLVHAKMRELVKSDESTNVE